MKQILVLGAGRSSSSLIAELLNRSGANGWEVHVGDVDLDLAERKCSNHPAARPFAIDPQRDEDRNQRIAGADLVISMVPAFMHPEIAKVAIAAGVPVITPSYVSPEMQALHEQAVAANVLVLNEIGLDPGIDHLSAKAVLDRVAQRGGKMLEFESYCGGLIAPESDDNPWHYKFSWNPRNVVLAGQGGAATFLSGGSARLVPPHRVFQHAKRIEVDGMLFEGYPNRDSVAYESIYGLKGIQTLIRGTLRGDGFCAGWDALVQLGCVRDDAKMEWAAGISWADWLRTFLPAQLEGIDVRSAVAECTGASEATLDRLAWLGLFDSDSGPARTAGTPAQVLQDLLEAKWLLTPTDRDMIVMWHRFQYELQGELHEITSSLRLEGRDAIYTGMSDTVGWPMAIAAEALLVGKFKDVGVQVPMHRDYYEVLLPELERMGVRFEETHRLCS
jgi:saccharopine dehydrogenase-like NADP-dependent oxidoreductase